MTEKASLKHFENLFLRRQLKADGFRRILKGQVALDKVHPVDQAAVVERSLLPALVGDFLDIRDGRVGKRLRSGVGDGARQIGDADMPDTVHLVERIFMRGVAAGFDCSARLGVDVDDEGNGTFQRYKKDSFYWYQKVIATNGTDLS